MTQLLFANNSQTSLAGSISNTALTANLQSGTGVLFPQPAAGQGFYGTFTDAATGLVREIVLVTNVTGDTITMIRGQDGTSAVGWSANDLFGQLVTAGDLANMVQLSALQAQSTNYAADTGSANAYLCAMTPAITVAPPPGTPLRILWANTNTGASTLNAGWGAVNILRRNGSACIGNEIVAGNVGNILWDGTNFRIDNIAPATGAAVSAGTDTQSGVTPAQLAAAVSSLPSGTIVPFVGSLAQTPATWFMCYGQPVSRTTYSALFALCGVQFGAGDGSTTFNLPDLRGRVVAGADAMGGTPAGVLGGGATGGITATAIVGRTGGEQSHAQTIAELATHTHTYSHPPSNSGASGGGTPTGNGNDNTGPAGSGVAANITQPTLVLNYIIKQ